MGMRIFAGMLMVAMVAAIGTMLVAFAYAFAWREMPFVTVNNRGDVILPIRGDKVVGPDYTFWSPRAISVDSIKFGEDCGPWYTALSNGRSCGSVYNGSIRETPVSIYVWGWDDEPRVEKIYRVVIER
jgi:hypothetical protein